MRTTLSSLADLVLGRSCAGCDAPGILVCGACRCDLTPRPRLRRSVDLADLAADLHIPVVCAVDYQGSTRQILYRFKDHRIPELAQVLAPPLLAAIEYAARHSQRSEPLPVLVPMPTRASSKRRRGFDHMEMLTRATCQLGGLSSIRSLLTDRRRGPSSKTLSAFDRENSAAGAFEVTGRITNNPVILVDDVVTTGATVREAAASCVLAGVNVVAVASVAGTP